MRAVTYAMALALTLPVGAAFGCSANAPSPSHPIAATTAALPPPAPGARPTADVEPPDPQVWTTPPDSDVCTAYPGGKVRGYQTYPTRAECEDWVKQRRCRPNSNCSDGCNDISCDRTGMRMLSTLVECSILAPDQIEFRDKTLRPQTVPDWSKARDLIERFFRRPTRSLVITGTALPDEVHHGEAAQKQLARRRAEMARRELTSRGIDAKRIRVEVIEPAEMSGSDYEVGRVLFRFDPAWLEQEEFDPSSPGYENLCWVKQARSKAPPTAGTSREDSFTPVTPPAAPAIDASLPPAPQKPN